jgi:hypothetical protein
VLATIVDTSALLKVIVASAIAGVGVSVAFSLVILGIERSAEARRSGNAAVAGAYLVLAIVALGAFGAVMVYGISVMASK